MSVGYPLAFGPANSAASTSPSCASSSLGNRPPCRRQPARRDQRHATRHATVMRSAARPPRPAPLPPAAPPARTCPQAASAAAATPQSPGRQPLACSMGIGKGDVPCTCVHPPHLRRDGVRLINLDTRTSRCIARVLAVFAALVLAGTLSPQQSLAKDPGPGAYNLDIEIPPIIEPGMTVDLFGQTIELAALVDYQTMAEEDGVSLLEVFERYGWQNEFAQVVSKLADAYPDDFAGAAVVTDENRGWIAFKDSVPAAARRLSGDLPKPVTLIGGRGFSEAELADALERYYYPVFDHPDVVNAYGSPDPETGLITITVEPHSRLVEAEHDRLVSELVAIDEEPENPHITVRVEIGEVRFDQQHHYRGGAHAYFNGTGNWCTWGFNVVPTSGGGGHGIASARHCDSASSATARYHLHGSGSSGTLTKVRHSQWSGGDMAFYRTSGHLVDGGRFYYDYQSLRTATTVARPTVGLRLCAYGRGSGNRCSNEVWRLNQCIDGICRLAFTTRSNGQGGDSGGPWYQSSTAYGIHTGITRVNLIWRDVFTPVSPNFVDYLQVRVRTG